MIKISDSQNSKSFEILGHPSSVYGHIVSGRHFNKAGNLKDCPSYFCNLSVTLFYVQKNGRFFCEARTLNNHLTLFGQISMVIFLWILHVQSAQHTINSQMQEQFLCSVVKLTTMKAPFMRSFSISIISELN